MKIPLADEEKDLIGKAAVAKDTKPVTWAREVLLAEAQRTLAGKSRRRKP